MNKLLELFCLFFLLLIYSVLKGLEIKNHQPGGIIPILLGKEFEPALLTTIEAYSFSVCIDREKPTTCAVASYKCLLEKMRISVPNPLPAYSFDTPNRPIFTAG